MIVHIFENPGSVTRWWLVALAAVSLLVLEHHVVAGFSATELRRRLHLAVGAVVILGLTALLAPAVTAQPAGAQLPDLISDPPDPSFFKELEAADGSSQLVVTFDGYVHNIGEGALDVLGNPQVEGGMRQRVNTNGTWEDAGAPTVRFEVDDGHNHFHLIEVVEYVLWNELQGLQTATGSKIGFCLVDSEQVDVGFDQNYSEEGNNFCEEDNPAATELHMGISPGWRDVYDATTTLQWVDVSTVAPGRYWIGAITDPNNEIVESDEENNDLIFSTETISVPGYVPRPQTIEISESDAAAGGDEGDGIQITLKASVHGTVGAPIYVIEQGPDAGTLDVPVGVDLTSPVLTYFPGPDYAGSDEFVFSVHDVSSSFPLITPTQVVELVGSELTSGARVPGAAPTISLPSTFFETTNGTASEVPVTATLVTGEPARVYALGLPRGLVADTQSGLISGVAIEEGIFEVEILALGDTISEATSQTVSWIVNPPSSDPHLLAVANRSSLVDQLARLPVARNVLGQNVEVRGLPPGVTLDEGNTALSGTPTEVGDFEVTVERIIDDEVVEEASFVWTIRAGTAIDFPL